MHLRFINMFMILNMVKLPNKNILYICNILKGEIKNVARFYEGYEP